MSTRARKPAMGLIAAAVIAAVVAGAATWLTWSWGQGFISDNLKAQQITFPALDGADEETKKEIESKDCLVDNEGQQLSNGWQARCYADDQIGLHMHHSAAATTLQSEAAIKLNGGKETLEGATYATLGKFTMGGLEQPLAEATGAEKKAIAADIEAASGLRDSMYRGETLRGVLLNAYGWQILVSIGKGASVALWLVAIALVVMALRRRNAA